MLRWYAPLADYGFIQRGDGYMGVSPGLGERTYLVRTGFAQLNSALGENSVVQYNPSGPLNWLVHLYSTAQTAAGDRGCGAAFGGDVLTCNKGMPYISATFNSPDDVRNWDLDKVCDAFSINLLVATDTDPVWSDPDGWVWTRKAVVANRAFRGIPCGTRTIGSISHQ
jgi:hypothetical protein